MRQEPNVSYAAELVREVRNDKKLPLKQVAQVSGYSISAINAYEHGHLPVPLDYVAGLFRCTGDFRLVQAVWPGVNLVHTPTTRTPPVAAADPLASPTETNALLLEALERLAAACRYSQKILEDCKVDESDHDMLLQEQSLLNLACERIAGHQAAMAGFIEQCAAKSKNNGRR